MRICHLYNWIALSCYFCFKWLYKWSNGLYSASLLFFGWFLWRALIVRPSLLTIPTIAAIQKLQNLLNQSYRVHITLRHATSYYLPWVWTQTDTNTHTNTHSHTHTRTHTHTHTHAHTHTSWTRMISTDCRNQAHWPVPYKLYEFLHAPSLYLYVSYCKFTYVFLASTL